MSDYIIDSALHILISKGAAHAQLGVLRSLLVFLVPENRILSFHYSDFAKMAWSVRKAIQAFLDRRPSVIFRGPAALIPALGYYLIGTLVVWAHRREVQGSLEPWPTEC